MANSNLTKIKKAFSALDEKAQLALIKDVYNFSKEMKTFLEHRLLKVESKYYFDEMEKLTYVRFEAVPPQWLDARKINAIISKAKKADIGDLELFKLHFYVFEAYVVWIDMYGISDEAVENKCAIHLVKALELLHELSKINTDLLEQYYQNAYDIVDKHDNMYRDHLYEIIDDFDASIDLFRPE